MLSLLLLPFALAPLQDPAHFTGKWTGEIDTVHLAVEVDLAHGDGRWSGDISIPAQGAEDLPLAGFELADGVLSFRIDGVPGEPTFRAHLGDDGGALEGTFHQAAFEAAFRLERYASRIPDTLAALEGLDGWLDERMVEWKVPGLALAVVRDGEVARVTGHGLRDVAQGLAVTPETLFAIGSSSKAFTTTTLGALATEGRFDWEQPLIDLLPGLRLHDEYANLHLTPRDMASHRSGLPRHDLSWYGREDFDAERILASLGHYEPNAELRETWQYNNLMFVTLGLVAARIEGRPWEQAVRARILEPLGMARTNFSVAVSQQDPDHALPYDEGDDAVTPIPFRDISHVGPAGSINSCARDMARWVLLQLSDGEVDGQRILSAGDLKRLHTPLAVVGGLPDEPELAPTLYGMGWFVDGYRGHLRVHHGGNIDGFSALVSFFPHDGLGIVVLTNRNATPLPELVVRQVADRVFGDAPRDWSGESLAKVTAAKAAGEAGTEKAAERRVAGTTPSHPLADYAGTFEHPGYGQLAIALEGDALRLSFHGMSAPLEHWHYDVFRAGKDERDPTLDGTMLSFETDLAGEITAVRAPLEPTLAPLRLTRAADPNLSDPAYLARFVGAYSLLGQRLEVTLVGDALFVTAPGQSPTRLVPRWKDTFGVEGEDEAVTVSFESAEGHVTEAILTQAGRTFVAERDPD